MLLENRHPNPEFFTQILLGGNEFGAPQWPLASEAPPELLPAGDHAPSGAGPGRGWACQSCTFRNPAPAVLCQVCERPRLAGRPQVWPCPRCTFLNRGHAPGCEMCGLDHAPSGDVIAGEATPTAAVVPTTSCSDHASSGAKPSTSCSGPASSGVSASTSCSDPASSAAQASTSCSGHASPGVQKATSGSGHASSDVTPTTSGSGSASSVAATATSCPGPAHSAAPTTSCPASATSCVTTTASCSGSATSGSGPAPSRDALRQRKLLEDGRRLVALVRAAESQGLPPEALGPAPFSQLPEAASSPAPDPASQIRHFRLRLKGALQALREAGQAQEGGGASFSLAEAAWAWLEGEGRPDHALRVLIGRRKQQLSLLASLGFPEPGPASASLRLRGGDQWEALERLQRLRLRPFRLRHFRGAEPSLDFGREDQQALVRQILAALPVASWGRAWLVAELGRELGLGLVARPSSEPLLGELVEAVAACAERGALRRRLRCECAVCGWALPRQRMQWLPGCSCPLCPECFRLHFTVGLRQRGVAALGCPSCGRPDLRDDAQRLCYWSTLEPLLRQCLDADAFGLVTRKLTELELLRDPQFLWCPHCSFGFIFEAEQGPAQCPQCHQRCCPHCQLPWDPSHLSVSCAEFGARQRSGDSGLGTFLGEPRIECPQCGQSFALARGGCLHSQCSQCLHQFCSACGAQFHQPGGCPSPQCPLRGSLHGHHPRDCLFYLRDWDPARLQRLLLDANVAFETEPPPEAPPTGQCPVLEQKELGVTLRDEPCGRSSAPGHAGLCSAHYREYLVSLINRHGLDPAPLYDPAELRAAAERHLAAGRSRRLPGEGVAEHGLRMLRLLRQEAPVRPRPPGAGRAPRCK